MDKAPMDKASMADMPAKDAKEMKVAKEMKPVTLTVKSFKMVSTVCP